jgi:hypothetical protein
MRAGSENRNKTIIAIVLGVVLLCTVGYVVYSNFGGSSNSAPTPQPAATNATTKAEQEIAVASTPNTKAAQAGGVGGLGAIPGVDAQRIASTSSSLDPTLDEGAMLRTENLVYSGIGRNIFSLVSAPPPMPVMPKVIPSARIVPTGPPLPPPPPPTCPPSCPPINLKFFGTATRGNVRQAFLLQGEDVFLASEGDIVAHKYKIRSIAASSVQVEDLSNGNTQTLPLQQ